MFFAVFNSLILVPLIFKYAPKEFTDNYKQKEVEFGAFILSFLFEVLMIIGALIDLFRFFRKLFKKNP